MSRRELQDSRLTGEDRDRIRAAMAVTVDGWRSSRTAPASDPLPCGAAEVDTLTRVGAGAIGCGAHDLRDAELAELATMAREVAS